MKRNDLKSLSLTTGAALVLGALGGTSLAEQTNPFTMTELSQGYSLASAEEAKCGKAKCGANVTKAAESKCGESGSASANAAEKSTEANCGANQDKVAESSCGENKAPAEANCGANK